jgi:hypothetical protein
MSTKEDIDTVAHRKHAHSQWLLVNFGMSVFMRFLQATCMAERTGLYFFLQENFVFFETPLFDITRAL